MNDFIIFYAIIGIPFALISTFQGWRDWNKPDNPKRVYLNRWQYFPLAFVVAWAVWPFITLVDSLNFILGRKK